MAVLFEWDDGAERSDLNQISVTGDASGNSCVLVDHAGSATIVCMPRRAVEELRDALTTHLDASSPEGVVRAALTAHHVSTLTIYDMTTRIVQALREAGHLA